MYKRMNGWDLLEAVLAFGSAGSTIYWLFGPLLSLPVSPRNNWIAAILSCLVAAIWLPIRESRIEKKFQNHVG